MYTSLKMYADALKEHFDSIPKERRLLLEKMAAYIIEKQKQDKPIKLVYICTHNSRRSHFGQIWAQVAAHYYHVESVHAFSGGTEATAFHTNAIHALKRIGFDIRPAHTQENSLFNVFYDDLRKPIECFSKVYDHAKNPQKEFAAIMTCSDAEENCPFIPGVELRIGTPYDDPKAFDNKPQQDQMYDERCRQIALETFYVFSLIN
jgi:arsenate reductase